MTNSQKEAVEAAEEIGYPVVLKGCSADLPHKTEADLIRFNLTTRREVRSAFKEIKSHAPKHLEGILMQEMINGRRELVMGMIRNAQFGPCVMFGLGGIYTEVLNDVCFRVAPVERRDAFQMMDDFNGRKMLGSFRVMPEADREVIAHCLISLGQIGMDYDAVKEIDVNPVILNQKSKPVAVDVLVVLDGY